MSPAATRGRPGARAHESPPSACVRGASRTYGAASSSIGHLHRGLIVVCTRPSTRDRFPTMQRFASLLCVIAAAACGGGTETGEASLSNTTPPVMSAAAKPFSGADGGGNMVLGWKIELYKDAPGASCTDASRVGTIGIYSNQAAGSGPQAILTTGF